MALPGSVSPAARSPPGKQSSHTNGATERTPLLPKAAVIADASAGLIFSSEADVPPASIAGSVFNLSNTVIGAGIMALPATLKILGLLGGLAAILLVALLTLASIRIIVRCSAMHGRYTYQDLVSETLGWRGRIALQVAIMMNNFGLLVVFLMIIGDVLAGHKRPDAQHRDGLLPEWMGYSGFINSRAFITAALAVLLAPLMCLRRMGTHTCWSIILGGEALVRC
eukprot:jgi/Chlat1/6112/Chrsp402S05655